MQNNITPGPWFFGKASREIHAHGINICRVFPGMMTSFHCASEEESDANARAIAALPELVEALQELVCCPAFTGALFETDKASHRAWTFARAALDKAGLCEDQEDGDDYIHRKQREWEKDQRNSDL